MNNLIYKIKCLKLIGTLVFLCFQLPYTFKHILRLLIGVVLEVVAFNFMGVGVDVGRLIYV